MADNHHAGTDQTAHSGMDYAEHEKTYKLFLLMTKGRLIDAYRCYC